MDPYSGRSGLSLIFFSPSPKHLPRTYPTPAYPAPAHPTPVRPADFFHQVQPPKHLPYTCRARFSPSQKQLPYTCARHPSHRPARRLPPSPSLTPQSLTLHRRVLRPAARPQTAPQRRPAGGLPPAPARRTAVSAPRGGRRVLLIRGCLLCESGVLGPGVLAGWSVGPGGHVGKVVAE